MTRVSGKRAWAAASLDFAGLDLGPVAVHRSRSFPRLPSRPPHSTHTAMYFVPQNEGREDRKSLEKRPSLGASETDSEMAPLAVAARATAATAALQGRRRVSGARPPLMTALRTPDLGNGPRTETTAADTEH